MFKGPAPPWFMSPLNLDDDDDIKIDSFDSENGKNRDPNVETDENHSLLLQDKNPLTLLEEAIDLLMQLRKSDNDDDKKHLEIIIDDILATALLWSAICKRETYTTQKAVESQMDELNQSILALVLETDEVNDANENADDEIGLESVLKALDIWSNLITKNCKTDEHLSKNINDEEIRQCNK